jgi:hypothetical protein
MMKTSKKLLDRQMKLYEVKVIGFGSGAAVVLYLLGLVPCSRNMKTGRWYILKLLRS